jgi:arginine exporter protein ArgO
VNDTVILSGLSGAGAGLGVAMPLGAVGVLLIQEGMRGWRPAAAAACAVALIDLTYATGAAAIGPAITTTLSTSVQAWVRLASAIVLMAMAAHGLMLSYRRRTTPADSVRPADNKGVRQAFTRFAVLTLINPLTALYFLAVATGNGGHRGTASIAFLTGVFGASFLWQLLLVTAGTLAGLRISATARAWTFNIGYGLVGLYALKLAWPLP